METSFFCDDDINFGRAGAVGFEPADTDVSLVNDPRTGRPWGDHGTAAQAIEYAFEIETRMQFGDPETFLCCWREGDLEEWPEFYLWLTAQEQA